MPWPRPTLSELTAQVASDIASNVQSVDPLLRFSNLQITGKVQAQMTNLQLGYGDYIARQAVPFTATDEFLEGWAGLKRVYRKPAVAFVGQASFVVTSSVIIPAGTPFVRGDGTEYTTTADVSLTGAGTAVVTFTATVAGAAGTCAVGTVLTLGTSIAAVQSTGKVTSAITPGADIEKDGAFRNRMLRVYQSPPQGGSRSDFETWALEVPGVTRAWVVPGGFGVGTVVVYVMFDITEAAYGGMPQGAGGVAAGEPRGVAATGDQLAVANYLFPRQPVTPLVYVWAPPANVVNFTIRGLASSGATIQSAVAAAITTVFATKVNGGGSTVYIADLETAIAAAAGTETFGIASPPGDIVSAANAVPILGTITWI
ncbi:MAG: baseplate J/gp47 family protein [Clostridiaceae bacterium]|nr:baseplate J/gp47 family protein [Clostridiaceae bacterium]